MKRFFKDFFEKLSNVSFLTRMELIGVFCGGAIWTFAIEICFGETSTLKPLFSILFVIIPLLLLTYAFIAIIVKLHEYEKAEIEQYEANKNHKIYSTFGKNWNSTSYGKYLENATNYYMRDAFEPRLNEEIGCAVFDFIHSRGQINSLYQIKLFYNYIRDNWSQYDGQEVTIFAFSPPYHCLSMSPLANRAFTFNYDLALLDLLSYEDSVFLSDDLYYSLVIEMQGRSFDNLHFDLGYYCAPGFDFTAVCQSKDAEFVKCTGKLAKDNHTGHIFLNYCRFEKYNYNKYCREINEHFDDIKYDLPKPVKRKWKNF